jgi:hypothetical protein
MISSLENNIDDWVIENKGGVILNGKKDQIPRFSDG